MRLKRETDCAERLRQLRRMLERYRHRRGVGGRRFVPTGLAPLDEALPHGGLPAGALTEVFSPADGVGAMTLAFRVAGAASQGERAIVIVDTRGDFYPPAAWQMGGVPATVTGIRRFFKDPR